MTTFDEFTIEATEPDEVGEEIGDAVIEFLDGEFPDKADLATALEGAAYQLSTLAKVLREELS